MGTPTNIPTRFALVKRAEKMVKDINDYFDDAHSFGLSMQEADPDGMMQKIKSGLVEMLKREGYIKGKP